MKEEFLKLAIDAAEAAGEIAMDFFNKKFKVEYKDDMNNNLVTEVDKKAENKIIDMVRSQYPDHIFLAEESGETGKTSNVKWIIDPLDGTVNYAHGVPVFCVSIGVEQDGEIVAGAVYDPSRDEMFTAIKGGGASLNGNPIRVSQSSILEKSMLATGFPYNVRENPGNCVEHFHNFLFASRALRRLGSAAIDACWVASGRFDGFYEVSLSPWDMAAASLIISEAGGKVTNFYSNTFDLYQKSFMVSNGLIHEQMMEVLRMVKK